jgi:hypothetical protein
MSLLKSLLEKLVPYQLQPDPTDAILTRLGICSQLGIILLVTWFLVNRPFWQHLFVALWAMAFATLMLPAEMMVFVRHPIWLLRFRSLPASWPPILAEAEFEASQRGRSLSCWRLQATGAPMLIR